jgi:hypothetical protein
MGRGARGGEEKRRFGASLRLKIPHIFESNLGSARDDERRVEQEGGKTGRFGDGSDWSSPRSVDTG